MSVHTEAVARAIMFLKAAGAEYKIILAGAEIANTIPVPVPVKAKRVYLNDHEGETHYRSRMKALPVGGVLRIERKEHAYLLATPKAWNSFVASFRNATRDVLGGDEKCVYEYKQEGMMADRVVSVLRVE